MAFKLFKSQEDSMDNPNLLPINYEEAQLKRWRNTWSFNLHNKVPLINESEKRENQTEKIRHKRIMRKYYGKKIRYVTRTQDLNSFVSRSKLLSFVKIEEKQIYKNDLKTKGNLVILGANAKIKGEQKFLCFKKILKHCPIAQIETTRGRNLRLLRSMLALRKLHLEGRLEGGALWNLLHLETIKVYFWMGNKDSKRKESNKGFFSGLHKLPRLQRVKFISGYKSIQEMNRDLERFYQKPFNFDFHMDLRFGFEPLEEKNSSSLKRILSAAEYLCIEDEGVHRSAFDNYSVFLSREKRKTTKIDFKNAVKISLFTLQSSNTLLSICNQINENCHSLQHLSFILWALADQDLLSRSSSPFWVRDFCQSLEVISVLKKINSFRLLTDDEILNSWALGGILLNPSLEFFQLNLFSQKGKISSQKWDSYFESKAKNQVKEFYITIPFRTKAHIFTKNLFNYLQELEDLEVVELVNESLKVIAFDYLYGMVMRLLEKKNMRKILMCVKVINIFYTDSFGKFFSKNLEAKVQNIFEEISQEWENRVKILKEGQLEEILIGELSGYQFSYLLFNKEMQVTDKLFWTKKEMEKLFNSKKELKRMYQRVFDIFDGKEPAY